jgi:hypothetical protein
MWERKRKARASDPGRTRGAGALIDRRAFLAGTLAVLAWPRAGSADDAKAPELPEPALRALAGSEFVYVSPLRGDGRESTCHGEVWYGWLDDAVVLVTSKDSWKARSVAQGLDRARLWVGSHGRWKTPLGGRSEEFRQAPSFVGRARVSKDAALLERLLVVYEAKYPAEIGRWRDRFRSGLASGERVLLIYQPTAGRA